MLTPILTAHTDTSRHLTMISVAGPIINREQAASIRSTCLIGPPTVRPGHQPHRACRCSPKSASRRFAKSPGVCADRGQQLVFVCSELMLRSELILADLDTLAPGAASEEQAVPLVGVGRLSQPRRGAAPPDRAHCARGRSPSTLAPSAHPCDAVLQLDRARRQPGAGRRHLRRGPQLPRRPAVEGDRDPGDLQRQLVRTNLLVHARAHVRARIGDLVRSLRRSGEGFAFPHRRRRRRSCRPTPAFQRSSFPPELMAHRRCQAAAATQRFSVDGEPYMAVGINIPRGATPSTTRPFPLGDTDSALRTISTALADRCGRHHAALPAPWAGRRAGACCDRSHACRPPPARSPRAGSTPAWHPRPTPTWPCWPDRSTTWPTRCRPGSSARPGSRPTSATSCARRSPRSSAAVEVLDGRRDDLPERSQQALDVVVGQVRRFDQMVMDLLELSRIDAGSTELHPRGGRHRGAGHADRPPLRVRRHCRSRSTRRCRGRARRQAALRADPRQPAGERPRARRRADAGEGRAASAATASLLSVEDAGPGVARGERARIFERFARGSAARHRVGTGLGLGAGGRARHAHGGEAWVEDRPGGGARVQGQLRGGGRDDPSR